MCGIVGSLNWNKPDPEALVARMTRSLAHRGPDAEHLLTLGPIVLGHRRLSVIDTSSEADQPMADSSGRFCTVLNGEVYNFKTLRAELEGKGHHFRTRSDTEVLLEAWNEWGLDCLERLVGMYAFAMWDSREERLFLVRDRMGEKPLYYQVIARTAGDDGGIVFASELRALELHPAVSNDVEPRAIRQFLSLNYLLTDCCILSGVQKLPPAHALILERGRRPRLHEYWSLSHAFQQKGSWASMEAASSQLLSLCEESVQGQSLADVPLGAFLSGGVDSSSVVATMARLGPPELTRTFSVGFREKTFSELPESIRVANHLGVDHQSKIVDVDLAASLSKIVEAMDEPFADTSFIPTYYLSAFARSQVTVCLSGDGGDELFAGYETYVADRLFSMVNRLPNPLVRTMARLTDQYWPTSLGKLSFDYKLKQFLKGCSLDFERAHYSWRTIFSDEECLELLQPRWREVVREADPFQSFQRYYQEVDGCDPIDRACYVDMKTWLVDDILFKVDRASMAHSLEVRAPFLDHRLVAFAASLPVRWKLRHLQKKVLLKHSQRRFLPAATLRRAKKGFSAPISIWLQGGLRTLARDVTLDPLMHEWFDRSFIESLWVEHKRGRRDNGLRLFGLTCLGLWLSQARARAGVRGTDAFGGDSRIQRGRRD